MAFFSNRTKLREGARPAVEAWTAEVHKRRDEFLQGIREEGITFEAWILEDTPDGLYLVSLMETDDYDKAVATYEQSTHAIDAYHRQFLEENRVGFQENRVLFTIRD